LPGKLFAKQLLRASPPSGEVDLARLGELVTSAYEEADRDRRRTDRAISLMIGELEQLNRELENLVADRTTELQTQNSRFDEALNNMSQGLTMFDPEARLVVCNRRYMEMYRVSPEVAKPGCTLRQLLQERINVGTFSEDLEEFLPNFLATIATGKSITNTVELIDGRVIVRKHRPMTRGGWVSTHEDVTERWRAEKKIEHMACHDALTDLPNRILFREELAKAIMRADRSGEPVAVLYLDLDHFKDVNDSLGHSFGDELLRAVAARLRGCLRATDTVARLGGDEFAIIQSATDQPQASATLAARVCRAVKAPFQIGADQVIIDVSIGVSLAPKDGLEPDELLKNADLALYGAKAEGRGTYRFFEPEMDARMKLRRVIEVDLRKAVVNKEFELYYQPIFDLKSGAICSFEALIRWHHPERGMILPAEFIDICEEIGLIVPIGEWALRTACAQAASWPENVKVAVNLSANQLTGEHVDLVIIGALADSGIAPSRLELEITEAVLLRDTKATIGTLRRIHDLGVHIVLDDFGTGYSSLSYLRSFPFDKIKIDRSFVKELQNSTQSQAIVTAIASLARSLGMASTAEGVETPEQLDLVRKLGCGEVQGYIFSVPRTASEITRMFVPHIASEASAA
jgi:diguanylate cyclase (GGDEF)-like protein